MTGGKKELTQPPNRPGGKKLTAGDWELIKPFWLRTGKGKGSKPPVDWAIADSATGLTRFVLTPSVGERSIILLWIPKYIYISLMLSLVFLPSSYLSSHPSSLPTSYPLLTLILPIPHPIATSTFSRAHCSRLGSGGSSRSSPDSLAGSPLTPLPLVGEYIPL